MYQYKDWELDSEEEVFFCHWLEELKEAGYIKSFSRVVESIEVLPKATFSVKVKGSKPQQRSLLRSMTYTPDFEIVWKPKADGLFTYQIEKEYTTSYRAGLILLFNKKPISLIDVKGNFKSSRITSSITFPIIQKVLYNNLKIYVQDVHPFGTDGLFDLTFTPKVYFKTPTGRDRKINWNAKTLQEYESTEQS